MIGRRSFPFGARPIFRCELLVSGRVYLQAVFCISKQRWIGTYLDGAFWCSWWRHRMKEDKHNRHEHMQCLTCIRIDVDKMMQNYTSIVRLNCSIIDDWDIHTQTCRSAELFWKIPCYRVIRFEDKPWFWVCFPGGSVLSFPQIPQQNWGTNRSPWSLMSRITGGHKYLIETS